MKKELTKKNKLLIGIGAAVGLAGIASAVVAAPLVSHRNISRSEPIHNNEQSSSISNLSPLDYHIFLKNSSVNQAKKDLNLFLNATPHNGSIFLSLHSLSSKNALRKKALHFLNEIYTGKISLPHLIKKIEAHYHNLTPNEKREVQYKMSLDKKKILDGVLLHPSSTFFMSFVQGGVNTQQFITTTNNFTESLYQYASEMTALASAATAFAAAEWAGLFVTWIEAAFTTAAVSADWVAAGLAWSAHNTIAQKINTIETYISNNIGFTVILKDISDLKDRIADLISHLTNAARAAETANMVDVWADPANAASAVMTSTLMTAIDAVILGLGIVISPPTE